MRRTVHVPVLVLLAVVVAVVPFSGAHLPSPTLCPAVGNMVHGYYPAAAGGRVEKMAGLGGRSATVIVTDSCASGDGDPDIGVDGAALPGGAYAAGCGFVSHHSAGVASTFSVTDHTGVATVVWSEGTDGPARNPLTGVPLAGCVTNGVITDNPTTDPDDCYGSLGYITPSSGSLASTFTGANGVATGPPVTACNGFDGLTWVFLFHGTIRDPSFPGGVLVSTPIEGDIS